MDNIVVTYRRLFAVEIWHDFFLPFGQNNIPSILLNELPEDYNIGQLVEIRPTVETIKTLENFGLKYLLTAKGVEVYANAIVVGANRWKTAVSLHNDIQLSFELFAKTSDFFSFTNLPLSVPFSKNIYLNNRGNNNTNDGLYLSARLPSFRTGTSYSIERVVKRGNNVNPRRIFVSIADSSVRRNLPNAQNNYLNTKWFGFDYRNTNNTLVRGVQVVTAEDVLDTRLGIFSYEEPRPNPGEIIRFTLRDVKGQSVPLGTILGTTIPQNEITVPANANTIRHQINLQHIKQGRYTMEISGGRAAIPFYLSHNQKNPKAFGVIELFGDPPQNDYRFFEERNQGGRRETIISEKAFKARFNNRIARWRYYRNGDTSQNPASININPFSKNVIQLTNFLPNPRPGQVKVEMTSNRSEIEGFYADLYLYDITI